MEGEGEGGGVSVYRPICIFFIRSEREEYCGGDEVYEVVYEGGVVI